VRNNPKKRGGDRDGYMRKSAPIIKERDSRSSFLRLMVPPPATRLVHFGSARVAENRFCSNKITTSLYSWLNVWWKLPYEEFTKAANAYFVGVSVLQMIPQTSNTNGIPTTLPPLMAVVFISIVLKLKEDAARHRADYVANTSSCRRKTGTKMVDGVWTDIVVGDIIKIHNHEHIPADVILLAAYEPDPQVPRGACHVETKGLDGETNLKGKNVPSQIANLVGTSFEQQMEALDRDIKGHVDCETPNPSTNKFTGTLHVEGNEAIPIGIGNVLLRGSSLRNADYVIGLVVNTGSDTKVMQGARKPPLKQSTMDASINKMMAIVAVILLTMCVFLSAASFSWDEGLGEDQHWYIDAYSSAFIWRFLYFLVLLASFVSVTLYVSINLCKFAVAWLVGQSVDIYDEISETRSKVRTATLVDELGVISHIFSDKTGTLTQNIMQFRKCSVNGLSYGKGTTEIGLARLKRLGQAPPPGELDIEGGDGGGVTELVNFDGPELLETLDGGQDATQTAACRNFFLYLAICHTVVTELVDGKKRLSASSPDESALVAAAAQFGYEFVDRHQDQMQIWDKRRGCELKYEVLDVLEFTSARRRMSVVVREVESGKYTLITKGADSIMMKLLASNQEALVQRTESHLEDHSNDGLRTLVIAARELAPAEYIPWSGQYRRAISSTIELEKKARDEPNEVDRLCDLLEVELGLLGSTAIEDKLQVGVPKCIADLGRGGISLWVLTGDKEETAINIAFACQLLDTSTKIQVINGKTHPTMQDISAVLSAPNEAKGRRALVIDGDALEHVLRVGPSGDVAGCQLAFLRYTQTCAAVVACRCAPSQKAELVGLVKHNVRGAITLAIGDGANDVAMIQAAHVGVGISGQEGMQAANSADFAIAQFRFLKDLLLVHGRNMYRRLATLINYVFYKNIMMVMTMVWYAFYSGYSGQKWNLEAGYQAYNAAFTFFPIIWLTIFDKDVSDDTSRRLPQLYFLGIRRAYYGWWTSFRWLVQAIYESAAISFICIYSLPTMVADGEDPEVFYMGAHTLTLVIIITNIKIFLWSWQQSWYLVGFVFLEIVFWWMCCAISSVIAPGSSVDTYVVGWFHLWNQVQTRIAFWLLLALVPAATLLPQFLYCAWLRQFYPEFRDLAQEAEQHKLPMGPLESWEIPSELRAHSLVKAAPVSQQKKGLLARLGC